MNQSIIITTLTAFNHRWRKKQGNFLWSVFQNVTHKVLLVNDVRLILYLVWESTVYNTKEMSSNYFKKLAIRARELDDGIEKLVMTWKLPHILIGRFAERTDETNSQTVWNIINNTQNGIEEIISEIDSQSEDSVSIEQRIQETKKEYENLKEQCNFLKGVLAEYGYHYEQNNILDQTNGSSSRSPNQNSADRTENLEMKFTPNLS